MTLNAAGIPVAQFGRPFSLRAPRYERIDLRAEKRFQLGFAEARLYLDVLNVLNRFNSGSRPLSLLDTYEVSPGRLGIYSFEYEGAPRIVALGAGLTF